MGKYDDILSSFTSPPDASTATVQGSGKYDDIVSSFAPPATNPPEIKQDYPVRRALMNYVGRPLIEGGAMTVGGLAGTALTGGNPIAGAALGAAMYPPAHQAANELDQLLGIGGRRMPPGTLPEQALNAAKQFQTGAEIEAGGKVLGAAVPAIADKVVRGGVPTILGPSREAVAARIENPSAIKGALPYSQQAERLPKSVTNIGNAIQDLDGKATSMLRSSPDPSEGAVPLSSITNILGSLQAKLKVGQSTVGQADKAATSNLGELINDLNRIVEQKKIPQLAGPNGQLLAIKQPEVYLPETTVKSVIQRLRKNINWDDKAASVTNSVLTDTSGQLDSILKTQNKTYAAAMRPVSNLTKLYNDLLDKFSLTKKTGEGVRASDATISSMKTLPADRRSVSQGVMRRLKAVTGEDYVGASKNRALADQFVGGNAQGSRRTLGGAAIGSTVGGAIGSVIGHPTAGVGIGSNIGAIAGMASDTSGREMAAKLVDAYVRARPYLRNIPYDVLTRFIASGALGPNPDGNNNANGQ